MTTAERSIRRLLQNPDASEDTKKHFKEANSDNDNDDLAKLYRLVWIDKHLPIKRATINRPTGRARCEEIQTPDECWVVETNAFAVLQAPMTIMIRQENLDCFDDLIKEHAGESFGDLAMSMSEAASTSEDHVDTGNDSTDIDKPDQTIASVPTSVFPNPFEAKVLREENINEGVVVTGQAGIGKSTQSLLILILRLHAHLPTIWQDTDAEATLFTEEGVFDLSFANVTLSKTTLLGKYFPPCTWLLFHSNRKSTWPELSHTNIFTVQSSCPRANRFSWMSKTNISMWYMKPLTLAELIMANQWQKKPQREVKLKEFYMKFAPSARTAYGNANAPRKFERKLEVRLDHMEYATLRKIAIDAGAHQMDDDVSHSILRFDPDPERGAIVSIPSPFILDMIIQRVIKGDAEKLRDWFDLFMRSSFSRGTAGWILDSVFHHSLLRKGQWPVLELKEEKARTQFHWRSVSPAPTTSYHMIFNSQAQNISITSTISEDQPLIMPTQPYDVSVTLNLRSDMCYYQPIQRNQATFDGFIWTGHNAGLAVVFQATVSESHTVKKKGFDWLLGLTGVKEVWYVAVTPADIKVDFLVEQGVVQESRIARHYHIKMNLNEVG